MIPGEIRLAASGIPINANRAVLELAVTNQGDRPIQVGSHMHFFECNRALAFDRIAAYGMRLDIPAGTAVRFEPGEEKPVRLCAFGGSQAVYGLNGLTNGRLEPRPTAEELRLRLEQWQAAGRSSS